jgi:hypothetical protein
MQAIQQRRVGGAKESFALKDLSALIPVTSTGMSAAEAVLKPNPCR